MFMIKKRNYIISLIIVFLVGGVVSYGVYNFIGGHKITNSELEEYSNLKNKYGRLIQLEEYLDENYYLPIDDEMIQIGLSKGLFASAGDPYTKYYTKEEYEKANADAQGETSGVGLVMSANEDNLIEIIEIIKGAPAEKAGVKVGDIIVEVDGEVFDGEGMNEAAENLRGEPGTEVALTVSRDGKKESFTLTRANFVNPTITTEILDGNIGYIKISSFGNNTAEDFEKALTDMENKNVNGLVIDMRNNAGGLVSQGVEIADLLMDKAVIAYTEDRKGNKEEYTTEEGRTTLKYTVLINENSASTTEILAAGIQESKSGEIVGQTSAGKGIIQQLQQFEDGDGCRITIMQYFTSSGKKVHEVGITPDFEIENTEDKDKQLEKAIELLKK